MPMHTMRPPGSVLTTGLQAFVETLPTGLLMAEVGSYAGESLMYFMPKVSQIICIDRWEDYSEEVGGSTHRVMVDSMTWVEETFDHVASYYGDRVVKVKDESLAVAARCPDATFDLVYIDASHNYLDVLHDIEAWWPKIKPGGLLAGHDYDTLREGVRLAVGEIFGNPDELYPDSTWVVRLTPERLTKLRERGMDGTESPDRDSVPADGRLSAV